MIKVSEERIFMKRDWVWQAGDILTVTKLRQSRPALVYRMTVLSDDGCHLVVTGLFAEPASRDLGFVTLERTDIWTEHYWCDRWYSVKEIRRSTGVLKGWYCDIAHPVEVSNGEVISEDLELDLWLSADEQTILRLDQDEFIASGLQAIDPAAAAAAVAALKDLESLAKDGFRGIDGLRNSGGSSG
jgi:hypothetical protein